MKKLLFILLFPILTQAQTNQGAFMYNYGAAVPVIFESGSLAPFTTVSPAASTPAKTFTFTASSLTGSVTATADAPMQVAPDGSTFATTAVFGQTLGISSGTVSVRIAASTAVGSYSGKIRLTSPGAAFVDVPFTATVTSGATLTVVKFNIWDASQTNGKVLQSGFNNWNPSDLLFGQTTTSGAMTDTTGASTAVTMTLSAGPEADVQGFYTNNGEPYAAATTAPYPDTLFEIPYLFTTGGESSGTDSIIFNVPGITPSSGGFNIELISSRSTGTSRPQTFTCNGTTIPLDAQNNLNNLTGGRVPLHWDNVPAVGGRIVVVMKYTATFVYANGGKISWIP